VKLETRSIITMTLTLNEEEAKFLRDYLQNWPFDSDEPIDVRKMRNEIFNALHDGLKS